MKKFFVLLLNLLVLTSAGFLLYNFYLDGLNSELLVECNYIYSAETNAMSISCDVNDEDFIISDDYPLTLFLYNVSNIVLLEVSLEDGLNNINLDNLDYNSIYSISVIGYNFTSDEFIETNFNQHEFSTISESTNIPTWVFTETMVLDTEYYFSLNIIDDDYRVESIDLMLYNSSGTKILTQNFIRNDNLRFSFTDLNPESDYYIEININYIINEFNELNEILVPIDFTTTSILNTPTSEITDILNDNITLSFSLIANNNDATNVIYTVELIDTDDNILYSDVVSGTEISINVSEISENYYISIKSSYLFNGVSYSEIELDTFNIYNNALSNFYIVPTLNIVNTNLPLTSYDDYDDYLYTYFNQGLSDFTITCETPLSCSELVSNDLYSNIPFEIVNFVHSYFDVSLISYSHSVSELRISMDSKYSTSDIFQIEQETENILNSIIIESMSDDEKILAVHDYVVNNTVYDTTCFDNVLNCDTDHSAIGVFIDGNAVCEGYANAIDILLRTLNIPTFRISSSTHQWNAVYYNDTWYHLDATWDDPITKNGSNILSHDYFLITSSQLATLDTSESHVYSTTYINFITN